MQKTFGARPNNYTVFRLARVCNAWPNPIPKNAGINPSSIGAYSNRELITCLIILDRPIIGKPDV